MNEKLIEYVEHFGENFPIFIARDLSEDEIINIIDECIENNKPYVVDALDDVEY